MKNNSVTYIFWLYGWNDTGSFLSTDDLVRCDVTTENIHIESRPSKDIPISLIQKCDVHTVGGRGFWRSMIKLKVSDSGRPKDVFIFPANPSAPSNEQKNGSEINAFSELINGIISQKEVTINPHPYSRNKIPRPWVVEELDAYTSPWVYHRRYKTKPSFARAVVEIIVTIVVLATLVILLGLFAEYLTHL